MQRGPGTPAALAERQSARQPAAFAARSLGQFEPATAAASSRPTPTLISCFYLLTSFL